LDTEALAQLERKRQKTLRGSDDFNKLFHRPSKVKPILIGIVIGWISLLLVMEIAGLGIGRVVR